MQCVYVRGISPSKILRGLFVIRIKLGAKEIFITPIISLNAYTYLRFVKSRKVGLQAAERLGGGEEAQVSTCIQRVSEALVKLSHDDPEGDVRLALKWMFLLSFRSPVFSYLLSLPYFLYLPLSFVIFLSSCPFSSLSFRFFLLFFSRPAPWPLC
jgi:hypothetical protein